MSMLPRCCRPARLRSHVQVGTERKRTRAELGNQVGWSGHAAATATASRTLAGWHLDSTGQPVQTPIKHAAALAHHACAGRCGGGWSLWPSQRMGYGRVVRSRESAAASLTACTTTAQGGTRTPRTPAPAPPGLGDQPKGIWEGGGGGATTAAGSQRMGTASHSAVASASATIHHVLGTASAGPVEDVGQIGEDAAQTSHVVGHCSIVRTATATTTTAPNGSPGKEERRVGSAVALLEHPPLSSTVGSPLNGQGGPIRTQLLLSTWRSRRCGSGVGGDAAGYHLGGDGGGGRGAGGAGRGRGGSSDVLAVDVDVGVGGGRLESQGWRQAGQKAGGAGAASFSKQEEGMGSHTARGIDGCRRWCLVPRTGGLVVGDRSRRHVGGTPLVGLFVGHR